MIGGGITNTLDLAGGKKIQDYLAGKGVSNQGPGGGTLYTAGGGTAAGGGLLSKVPKGTAENVFAPSESYSGINIDAQGNITGQKGLGRMISQFGNMSDFDSFDPKLQSAIKFYQQSQPAPGVAAGIAGMIPAMGETRPALYDPRQRAIDEGYQPGSGFMYEGKFYESGNPGRVSMDMAPLDSLFANNPAAREAFKESGMKLVMNPNPGGQIITSPGQEIHSQSPSQQPAFFPQQPTQQPTGGFDSKAFANELLTGIGDLFKQHFPESAQMAFNNSNQMQSQIEQPIQDATTFDVQPQQNMAFNPFSVNTLGGSFGGGY